MNRRRTTNLLLLAISAAALATGLSARLIGEPQWADWVWLVGSAPVLLVVLVGIARAVLRREAGVDLIALLSMTGAMTLGEYLIGAVIGLMLASGRSLGGGDLLVGRRGRGDRRGRLPDRLHHRPRGRWPLGRGRRLLRTRAHLRPGYAEVPALAMGAPIQVVVPVLPRRRGSIRLGKTVIGRAVERTAQATGCKTDCEQRRPQVHRSRRHFFSVPVEMIC